MAVVSLWIASRALPAKAGSHGFFTGSYANFIFDSGSSRTRLPVAAKMALANAGEHRRHAGFADARRQRVALDQVHVHLDGRVVHPRDLELVEVALLDAARWRR